MRVLLISSSSGSHGGGEFYLNTLADGLLNQDCEVVVLMSDGKHMNGLAEMMPRRCDVIRAPLINTYHRKLRTIGSVLDSRQARTICEIIKKNKPDIVHINKQCVDDGLSIVKGAVSANLPTVATVHVTRSMQSLGASLGLFRDWMSRRVMRQNSFPIITVSQRSADDWRELVPQSRVCVVPNGTTGPTKQDRIKIRESWDVSPSEIVVGTIARIEEQKNPLFMPQIVADLPSHVHMVWIGDGRMREDLEAEIERHNVADRFHLLGWKENAKNLLCGMDVFVLPSIYEGFPFAILEAMSVGLPCVVSDVDGNGESVVDGTTGDVLPVNDVGQWTRSLERLVLQDGLRKEYGEAALARFSAEYDVSIMAKRTVAVYEEAIQQHKQRGQTTL